MRIEKTILGSAALVLMSWLLVAPSHAGTFAASNAQTLADASGAITEVGFRGRRGFHHRRFRHRGFHGRRFGFRRHGLGFKRYGYGHRRFHHRRFGHSRFRFGRKFHGGFRGVFRSGR